MGDVVSIKRGRRGRPPMINDQQRTTQIRVCVTKAEQARLKAAAAERGCYLSAWLRSIAFEAVDVAETKAKANVPHALPVDRPDRPGRRRNWPVS